MFLKGVKLMTVTLFKAIDKDLFEEVTKEHSQFFRSLEERIPAKSNVGVFIASLINDYRYDINEQVCSHPANEINRFWNGSTSQYADNLKHDMKNAENAIVNCYLLYQGDKDLLDAYDPSDMNLMTMEYLEVIGTNRFCDKPSVKEIMNLSNKQKKELNLLLRKTGLGDLFDYLSIDQANVISFSQALLAHSKELEIPSSYNSLIRKAFVQNVKQTVKNFFFQQ